MWCLFSLSHYKYECIKSKFFSPSDVSTLDFDAIELQILSDALKRFFLDLPNPVIPASVYNEMISTAQGMNVKAIVIGSAQN